MKPKNKRLLPCCKKSKFILHQLCSIIPQRGFFFSGSPVQLGDLAFSGWMNGYFTFYIPSIIYTDTALVLSRHRL